jgi:hypothetical protein
LFVFPTYDVAGGFYAAFLVYKDFLPFVKFGVGSFSGSSNLSMVGLL